MESILTTASLGNPIEFKDHIFIDGLEIQYVNLMEVNQGSPLVGNLLINNKILSIDLRFGGLFYIKKGCYTFLCLFGDSVW